MVDTEQNRASWRDVVDIDAGGMTCGVFLCEHPVPRDNVRTIDPECFRLEGLERRVPLARTGHLAAFVLYILHYSSGAGGYALSDLLSTRDSFFKVHRAEEWREK